MPDRGLYVHVPFCVHKCGYCDFNSWAETRSEFQWQWLEAITRQAQYWSPRSAEDRFDTVFWGGGTPSLLDSEILTRFMRVLQTSFRLAPHAEITVECNPETLNADKLSRLWDAGVNRLSIGIQSFQDDYLARLERQTTRESNLRVLELVAKTWPGRWSLDLMFALPEQSLEQWLAEMDLALEFSPSHISAYQLTLSTARSKNWKQAPEDELLEFFVLTQERLLEAGLHQYEISNYAKPGHESQHNLHYWRLDPFLGIGPGAAGLLPAAWLRDRADAATATGFHQRVAPRWEHWLRDAGTAVESTTWLEPRTSEDHLKEMLMMNLRLNEGFSLTRWGVYESRAREAMEVLQSKGLTEFLPATNRWRASTRGMQILDTTIQMAYALIDFAPSRASSADLYVDPAFAF
ncbi:MAG TPA: radical SAM family heme chaperone HemW [Bdellovibrionota bacterium]|nr:radical SAM family heme chaperone HemW [Bdellovibrionota bacterium]